jgi:hypothetical protein
VSPPRAEVTAPPDAADCIARLIRCQQVAKSNTVKRSALILLDFLTILAW